MYRYTTHRACHHESGYDLDDWAWGVPLASRLARVPVQLGSLRKVHRPTERILRHVRKTEAIGVEFEMASSTSRFCKSNRNVYVVSRVHLPTTYQGMSFVSRSITTTPIDCQTSGSPVRTCLSFFAMAPDFVACTNLASTCECRNQQRSTISPVPTSSRQIVSGVRRPSLGSAEQGTFDEAIDYGKFLFRYKFIHLA